MSVKKSSHGPISKLVRKMRKHALLTQNELAELAGVGKTLVFDLENGHENIRFENLRKILQVLNIQISFSAPQIEDVKPAKVRK